MFPHPQMTAPFELTGQFGGFVFNDAGKRRMVLRQGDGVRLLKVPRLLRRSIIGKFRPGETIQVAVTGERHPGTGALKEVVSQILSVAAHPSAATRVVRVCSKKNCWRQGGRELWEALEREAAAAGEAGNVEIRQVGCLDRCKQAPNADCGKLAFSRCSPREAGAIIARAAGGLPRQESRPSK